ncbi:MAG TPA: haloacid dehalogenase-like hydrolase [Myxococcales bacterium]|nr:haloacid dehalogenase-like hydrolase [Myxococcales bacterium]
MIPDGLDKQIEELGRAVPGGLAVFDADGTLWREDIGEAFLRHLVKLGWVKLPGGRDPYEAYEEAVAKDRKTGYAYAAQLLAGLSQKSLAVEAIFFASEWVPSRLISDTAGLIALCRGAGLQPFVISASPLPIVLASAPLAGFDAARCRGIETAIADGIYTENIIEPVTYAKGKIDAARAAGELALACGDSLLGDLPMLEAARVAVAVSPRAGSPLSAEANRRAWPVLTQESGS